LPKKNSPHVIDTIGRAVQNIKSVSVRLSNIKKTITAIPAAINKIPSNTFITNHLSCRLAMVVVPILIRSAKVNKKRMLIVN